MSSKAWRQERDTPSLSEVFRTIAVGGGVTPFRRFLSFVGPGYLVAVGYMDPGNWATSLAGGAAFGYTLLFVALLSNIMAILLQSLCALSDKTIVFVSHKPSVAAACDRIGVVEGGRIVAWGSYAELTAPDCRHRALLRDSRAGDLNETRSG